jgi:hypothetical protein
LNALRKKHVRAPSQQKKAFLVHSLPEQKGGNNEQFWKGQVSIENFKNDILNTILFLLDRGRFILQKSLINPTEHVTDRG